MASVNNAISGNGMQVTSPSYVIQRLSDPSLIAARLQYPITGDFSGVLLTFTYKCVLRLRLI